MGVYRAVAFWLGFLSWASFSGVRCRNTLPLTGVVGRLRRFLGFIDGERYGSFSFFKNLIDCHITLVQARGSIEFTSLS